MCSCEQLHATACAPSAEGRCNIWRLAMDPGHVQVLSAHETRQSDRRAHQAPSSDPNDFNTGRMCLGPRIAFAVQQVMSTRMPCDHASLHSDTLCAAHTQCLDRMHRLHTGEQTSSSVLAELRHGHLCIAQVGAVPSVGQLLRARPRRCMAGRAKHTIAPAQRAALSRFESRTLSFTQL